MRTLTKEIIIYDGLCVLCNNIIRWVIKRDENDLFLFSNLDSEFIKEKFPDLKKNNSVAVIQIDGKIIYKSNAVRHILNRLKKFLFFRIILNTCPLFLSNFFYDIVAKTRYIRCIKPNPEKVAKKVNLLSSLEQLRW